MTDVTSKIMDLETASVWARALKASGRRLAVTNGVFDLLHRGHVEYLQAARACADALLVAINSDSSVRELKGTLRPIVSQDDRAYLLASLECVDAVCIFEGVRATAVFEAIAPDVYVKGGDYTEEKLDRGEHAVLTAAGARFQFIPFVAGHSTTSLISRIAGAWGMSYILSRRSVRKFQARAVDDSLIKEILRAAMAAPSACCSDPWHFIVLRDASLRAAVASKLPHGHFLADAPTGLVIAGDLGRAVSGELSYMLQDCSAAIENLLLASSMSGLGACWLGVHPRQERVEAVTALLGLPDGIIPVAAVALGWPAEQPKPRTRYREEAVHTDGWLR